MGVGGSESITIKAEASESSGGFYERDQTVTSTQSCVAGPMTRVTCQYVAYKGSINVGYTIHWTDGSTTRGEYKGQGWKSELIQTTKQLY